MSSRTVSEGSEDEARDEVVAAARAVAARGLSHGSTGNVSVRHGERIIVTPTRSSLSTVEASELAVVDLDGRPLTDARPSKEAFLHAAVYRGRPTAGAVVHTHSLHATAVSCLGGLDPDDAMAPLTAYYAMRVVALPLVDYFAPGDERLADRAGEVARGDACMLLRNHGPVVAADRALAAVDVAEEIEHMARIVLLVGARETSPLTQDERERLYANNQRGERT
ncbi:class II aldolase/adducin family protein [Georgenia sp. Z1491]|uniref:class II aldolase/adducin family protein n=1 Tax=Georgenia sp. Z1491 TaxID=3416707 RepID=UPI003CED2C7A